MESDATHESNAGRDRRGAWRPRHEPFGATVARNATIALVIGGVIAWRSGRLVLWPTVSCAALWLTFGGHYLEIFYLNWLRPRLEPSRVTGVVARLSVWFVGGILLGIGVVATLRVTSAAPMVRRPAWWLFGAILVIAELVVHAALALRRRPSFYDGTG